MNTGMNIDALLQVGPELILLGGACVVLMMGLAADSWRNRFVSATTLAVVMLALVASVRLGVPEDGFAIPGLWLSSLTYYTRCVALGIGGLIVLVNWHQPVAEERGEYMGLILFSLLGVILTASANDLVTLFFAIELVSIPTYVLIALSRTDARATESAVKYFFLGAMSAAILAYGMTFLYGATGTTVLFASGDGGAVSHLMDGQTLGTWGLLGLVLVFAGLAFKIAAVPLHVYVADVYEGAASPMTGMLGFVPKLAGFVALIKIFSALNWELPTEVFWMLWVVAAITMTAGNVLALLQKNVKRMLAYSSVAHSGYMLIGLLVGPSLMQVPMRDGIAALLFYMAVYGAMNLGAFAALSAFRIGGRDVETLDDLAGLHKRAPLAAFALAVCAFSLMGFPPTAGFIGKLYIFSGAFSVSETHVFRGPIITLAIIAVVNSAIGAAYYLRIAASVYLRSEVDEATPTAGRPVRVGLAICSVAMFVVFAMPGRLAHEARNATSSLTRMSTGTLADVAPISLELPTTVATAEDESTHAGHGRDRSTGTTLANGTSASRD